MFGISYILKTVYIFFTLHVHATDVADSFFADFVVENNNCESNVVCNHNSETIILADLSKNETHEVLVVTVASQDTDGLSRYLRSAQEYGLKPHILGYGKPWLGGEVQRYAGGGYKINLLRSYLEDYKNDQDRIVLFTDSFDIIFLSKLDKVVKNFLTFNARVVFAAEDYCWPKESLASQYPQIKRGKPYLNSGGFIGYAADLYKIITLDIIENEEDDQLYYTNVYLNKREEFNIKLDHTSEIFQNLNGAFSEVQLQFEGEQVFIVNNAYKTHPLILHGNGISKTVLNSLSSYLANSWSPDKGCITCWEQTLKLDKVEAENFPIVVVAVFIEEATPFLEEFLEKIYALDYPKTKIHLFVHNAVKYHTTVVEEFLKQHSSEYVSLKSIEPADEIGQWSARNLALNHCINKKCDYYFNVDSEAHVDNKHTLKLLIEQNRTVVAPMLVRPEKSWSNFWGALSVDGFYARSFDYMDIVHNERRGLWNVPFIGGCYLINSTLLKNHGLEKINYVRSNLDADMAFCANLRELNVFMYVSNRLDFGHLVNPDTFDTTRSVPEMYQIFENRIDWEQRYIRPDYVENFNPNNTAKQPCPDVYWFPVTTMRFCTDLIQMMEAFGQWSDGKNSDPRLDGGYEAVPTRDIHMNQVGWEQHWLHFLKEFVKPLQELVFTGYFHDPPRSLMNFVVRYRPDEQPSLRPHHDSSTYTINLALNTPELDYEGGGCKFIRYNCSVTNTKPGWLLMHPGRLTHFHEGLLVTKGTRYIMISFVDP